MNPMPLARVKSILDNPLAAEYELPAPECGVDSSPSKLAITAAPIAAQPHTGIADRKPLTPAIAPPAAPAVAPPAPTVIPRPPAPALKPKPPAPAVNPSPVAPAPVIAPATALPPPNPRKLPILPRIP